ncbi:MAG: hypothetical protein ACD_72C00561G0007 [uncultured bacterium]|uniref:DUF11 domain-containing protein n=1 Tax=Candidatus Magasanikbacteria bacterium RIFOXYD2_FULL_36_9 TaxID=1798707 RepID=A0A1F6NYN4_9BACT|nr:MAG: hypothetical protein ACD_72C00561G0007 [uncultured bacterium]OGH89001.1 MAG: hypothetical protein A2537_01145 [Candidatus Magasanikbacteria bacterium RIFOXYD2_FULL_36_9]
MSDEKITLFNEEYELPKKPKRRVIKSKTPKEETYNDQKIDRQLNNIYKDDSGNMPDMRRIKKAHTGSFIGGLFKFTFSIAILAALAWAGFFFLPMANKFSDSQLELKIIGPESFTIGATTTYQIVFKNNQKVTLNNVNLTTNYPSGFIYSQSSLTPKNLGKNEWNVGTLKPNEEKTLQITGNSFGSLGDAQSWRVLLNYTPDNFKSEMQKIATLDVKPNVAPISVTLTGIDKIGLDTPTNFTITIESKDNLIGKTLEVNPIFPSSFSMTSSSIPLLKNIWKIQPSTSTIGISKYVINFSGKFTLTDENYVPLKVQVKLASSNQDSYLLSETVINTEIIKNAITVNTAINGSLTNMESKPGEVLNVTVLVKNSGKENIDKAQIKLVIDSPSYSKQSVLSWSDIADKNDGDITGSQISDQIRRATLIWNDKKIAHLNKIKAGEEVSLDFQLPIKNSEKAPWNSINENQIKITTELIFNDSTKTSQTISGNNINISLNSDLSIQIKNDVSSDEKENEKHDITWILNNTYHPLKNITVSADIYGDITWQGPSSTLASTVDFNQKTKHLIWTIPEMTDNTDVLTLPFTVTINKKNPTQNTLISKIHITADDTVSGNKLEMLGDELPTNN